jgi:hypothetical protein
MQLARVNVAHKVLGLLRDNCRKQLGLQRPARLACCSKEFRKITSISTQKDAADVLLGKLEAAEAAAKAAAADTAATGHITHAEPFRGVKAMLKLLHSWPALPADMLARMEWLPSVRLQQAQKLLAAGVRIHYPELLAAASSMVPGLEVWEKAQKLEGIQSDIPAAAALMTACGDVTLSDLIFAPHAVSARPVSSHANSA